ncbi:AimR family lysis-lysogeny pheromone receptor [Alkalihalobacillus sp. NPDC078783]
MTVAMKEVIKLKFHKDSTLCTKVSGLINSKRQGIYQFLNNDDREMSSLPNLLKLLEAIEIENRDEVLDDYFQIIKVNTTFSKQALEYSFMNRLAKRYEMLDRLESLGNRETKEWCKFYKLIERVGMKGFNEQFDSLRTKNETLSVLKKILHITHLYKIELFDECADVCCTMEKHLSKVDDELIQKSYRVRVYRVMSTVALFLGRVDECRRMTKNLIDFASECSLTKGGAYHQTGMSYLFTSYELGIINYNKALANYSEEEIVSSDIVSSINVHNAYWKVKPFGVSADINSAIQDRVANLVWVNRDYSRADQLLDSYNEDNLSTRELAFHFYFKSIIHNDFSFLSKSVKAFRSLGDKFYINLALKQMRAMGIPEEVVELI